MSGGSGITVAPASGTDTSRDAAGIPASWLALLVIVAAARLLLQVLAMPPYAGLDEGFHVARVEFVAVRGRQPSADEPSLARYFSTSFNGQGDGPPSFGMIKGDWREHLAGRPQGWSDPRLSSAERSDFVATNYEAQQASLYYALAAPVDRAFGGTPLSELLALRLLSVPLGCVTALATGLLAARWWGKAGFLAGLLLVATPTWITLVGRAGNDGLACAALAVALCLSARPDGGWAARTAEAGSWFVAAATKLYAWPAALLLPLVWPRGASRSRRVFVAAAVAVAVIATAIDLNARNGNPTGKFELRAPGAVALSLDSLRRLAGHPWFEYAKAFVASAIWTSGPHSDFLRKIGVVLFLAPWILLVGAGLAARRDLPRRRLALLVAAAAVFAIAELGQAWGAIRQSLLAPSPMPSVGLAGWYVHAFDPIWFGAGLGFAIAASRRRGWTALLAASLAGALLADLLVTEGALFPAYAGLSSPSTPGALFRWGGGDPWHALVRLGRVGVGLASPWVAVGLRAVEIAAFAALAGLALRRSPPGRAERGDLTV